MNAALAHDAEQASDLLIEHYRRTGEYFIAQMDV